MAVQIFYEDVAVDAEIPLLFKYPTTMQLVKFAGATDDYYQIHYDKDFAQASGLPGVAVHGWLTFSFLGQLITDWIGEQGRVKKLTCSYKDMNFPGEASICKAKVTKKYVEDGECLVECSYWVENERGEKKATGKAVSILPSRDK
ncbi:MaoC/PaaZ C-terminal domain-containing protein [Chloroflexota bacterium]